MRQALETYIYVRYSDVGKSQEVLMSFYFDLIILFIEMYFA